MKEFLSAANSNKSPSLRLVLMAIEALSDEDLKQLIYIFEALIKNQIQNERREYGRTDC